MNANMTIVVIASVMALGGCDRVTKTFALVENGVAANVVKAPEAEKAVAFFVTEAAKCGVKFPVVEAPVPGGRNVVFEIAERPPMEMDAFEILPKGDILVVHCTKRSARWAMNRILHDALGIRWIFPNTNNVGGADLNEYPVAGGTIAVSQVKQKPYDFPFGRSPTWRVHDVNRYDGFIGSALCHNMFADVFRWRKYAYDDSWPEEIMPVRNGKKFVPPKPKKFPPESAPMAPYEYRNGWNICFTNPKAVELAVADALEDLKIRPNVLVRGIELNDNGGMCECESCHAAVGGKRNSMGYPDWSVPYWSFVSKVAEGVGNVRGDVRFTASAYREGHDAPPFRIDRHVIPDICFEVVEMLDPSMHKRHMNTLAKWDAVSSGVGIYDYNYGIGFYLLPRVYFTEWPRLIREIKRTYHSILAYTTESKCNFPFDGPRLQVIEAVLRDVDVDPWGVVHEWCVDAVGSAAAPDLEAYYRFWDDYWRGDRIRQTAWFRGSVANIYMQIGERSTHTFALRRGDMAKCRRLMEGVVAKAVTPLQKKRAKVLMGYFELAECAAIGLLSEYVEPDSHVKDAQTAVEMLNAVPAACAAIKLIKANPFANQEANFTVTLANLGSVLALILPYKDDLAVKATCARLAKDEALPMEVRGMCGIWSGAKAKNILPNGSFEQNEPLPSNMWAKGSLAGANRSKVEATDGEWSLGMRHADFSWFVPVQTNKTYMLIFDVKDMKGSAEGRFSAILSPCNGSKVPVAHVYSRDNVLSGGKWSTISLTTKTTNPKTKYLRVEMYTQKYEPSEIVLLDNVRLYCLDDLK